MRSDVIAGHAALGIASVRIIPALVERRKGRAWPLDVDARRHPDRRKTWDPQDLALDGAALVPSGYVPLGRGIGGRERADRPGRHHGNDEDYVSP